MARAGQHSIGRSPTHLANPRKSHRLPLNQATTKRVRGLSVRKRSRLSQRVGVQVAGHGLQEQRLRSGLIIYSIRGRPSRIRLRDLILFPQTRFSATSTFQWRKSSRAAILVFSEKSNTPKNSSGCRFFNYRTAVNCCRQLEPICCLLATQLRRHLGSLSAAFRSLSG